MFEICFIVILTHPLLQETKSTTSTSTKVLEELDKGSPSSPPPLLSRDTRQLRQAFDANSIPNHRLNQETRFKLAENISWS